MRKESKYYALNSKTLAQSLNYLGFEYITFDSETRGKIYSFKNSNELHQAIAKLNMLRREFKKY